MKNLECCPMRQVRNLFEKTERIEDRLSTENGHFTEMISVRNFQLNVFVCSRAATIRELFLNDFLNRIIGLGDL